MCVHDSRYLIWYCKCANGSTTEHKHLMTCRSATPRYNLLKQEHHEYPLMLLRCNTKTHRHLRKILENRGMPLCRRVAGQQDKGSQHVVRRRCASTNHPNPPAQRPLLPRRSAEESWQQLWRPRLLCCPWSRLRPAGQRQLLAPSQRWQM